MELLDRLKKEMSEGVVKALLEDAQYRVIDSGIEKIIREIACLTAYEYALLHMPDALTKLPDFTVMDKEQKSKSLVEIKYRSEWNSSLIEDVRKQVELFGELVLVCFNAKPNDAKNYDGKTDNPSRHLRCCRLKMNGSVYSIKSRIATESWEWVSVAQFVAGANPWWGLTPLQEEFQLLKEDDAKGSVKIAIKALSGLL